MSSSSLSSQAGSILTAALGVVAVIGVLSFSAYNLLSGPVRTAAVVTAKNMAQNEMITAARLLMRLGGDYDGTDLTTEPPEFATGSGPVGGGVIPSTVGASKTDPWGLPYGYCAWNHGSDNSSSSGWLQGSSAGFSSEIVIALVSAGPNRIMETTCVDDGGGSYVQVDANSDDIIVQYTFDEASSLESGLWSKTGLGDEIAYGDDVIIGDSSNPVNNLRVHGTTDVDGAFTASSGAFTGDVAAATGTFSGNVVADSLQIPTTLPSTLSVSSGGLSVSATAGALNYSASAASVMQGVQIGVTGNRSDGFFDDLDAVNFTLSNDLAVIGDLSVNGTTSLTGNVSTTNGLSVGGQFTAASSDGGLITNLNADQLDGQEGSYYRDADNINAGTLAGARLPAFGGDVGSAGGTASLTVTGLRGNTVSTSSPGADEVLGWNGSAWTPMSISASGGAGVIDISGLNDLATDGDVDSSACSNGESPVLVGGGWDCGNPIASGGTSDNSDELDGLDSTQFLRSDVSDTFSGPTLTITNNLAAGALNVTNNATVSGTIYGALGTWPQNISGATNMDVFDDGSGNNYLSFAGTQNTFLGYQSGAAIAAGQDNLLLGYQAGTAVSTGSGNVALGASVGASLDAESRNILIGLGIDTDNTDDYLNIGNTIWADMGTNTLFNTPSDMGFASNAAVTIEGSLTVTGTITGEAGFSGDIALPIDADLATSPTGVIIDINAGVNNFLSYEGIGNLYMGTGAGDSIVPAAGDAEYNTVLGSAAGTLISTGSGNTLVGASSGAALSSGDDHVLIGYNSGATLTTETSNIFIGNAAGYSTATGENVFIGDQAGEFVTSGANNILLGFNAGIATVGSPFTGADNVMIGHSSGLVNQGGAENVFIGDSTGIGNTTGTGNVYMGWETGSTMTTGNRNILIGRNIEAPNPTDNYYINLGNVIYGTIGTTDGEYDTTADASAALTLDGTLAVTDDVAIGDGTFDNPSANEDLYVEGNGEFDGNLYVAGTITGTISPNFPIDIDGEKVLFNDVAGSNTQLIIDDTTDSIAMGRNSGSAITSGASNVFLGENTGTTTATGSNNIIIGHDIDAAAAGTSNYLNIGRALFGDMGTTTSDDSGDAALTVDGDLTINRNTGDTAGGNLTVENNASIAGTLGVTGTTTLSDDLIVGNGTFDNPSVNEDAYVEGNLEVDGVIYGDGSGITGVTASDISIPIDVNGENVILTDSSGSPDPILQIVDTTDTIAFGRNAGASLAGETDNILIGAGVDTDGTNNYLNIGNTLFGSMDLSGTDTGAGSLTMDGNFTISRNTGDTAGGDLTVENNASITGTLGVTSTSSFTGDVSLGGGTFDNPSGSTDLYVTGNAEVDGLTYFTGVTTHSADVLIGSGTFDNPSVNPDLYVTGNLEVDGAIYGDGSNLTGVTASGVALDDIAAADGSNTITNGTNAQLWQWALTAPGTGFEFGESTAASGGGASDQHILSATTALTSTAIPFFIENLGDGASFRVDDESGDATPFLISNTGNVSVGGTLITASTITVGDDLIVGNGTFDNPSVNEDAYVEGNLEVDGGLYIADTNFHISGCGDNEILKYDSGGGTWQCEPDAAATLPIDVDSDVEILNYGGGTPTATFFRNIVADQSFAIGEDAGAALADVNDPTNNILLGYHAGTAITSGSQNIAIGANTLEGRTTEDGAVAVGHAAGRWATGGTSIYIGQSAGSGTGSGTPNTGTGQVIIGYEAGGDLGTDSHDNTFIGWRAGRDMTTGTDNVLIGREAGADLTTHDDSVFIGQEAGRYYTAAGNVGIGFQAGMGDGVTAPSGTDNTFIGNQAGHVMTSGAGNTVIGDDSGLYLTSGSYNTVVGWRAGQSNGTDFLTGDLNVLMGHDTGSAMTSGSENTMIGTEAGEANTTGTGNTFMGDDAGTLNDTGGSNVMIGHNAGDNNTGGSRNILIGADVDNATATTDDYLNIGNTIFGDMGTNPSTPGSQDAIINIAGDLIVGNGTFDNGSANEDAYVEGNLEVDGVLYGDGSGLTGVTATASLPIDVDSDTILMEDVDGGNLPVMIHDSSINFLAIGESAGEDVAGGVYPAGWENTLIGTYAGQEVSTGAHNVMLGDYSGNAVTTGIENTLVGSGAGRNMTTTSSGNTIMGRTAGQYNQADNNTLIGYYAGRATSGNPMTGTNNTFLGYQTGLVNTSGADNVFIGDSAGDNNTTGSRNILIGSGVDNTAAGTNDHLNIGNTLYGDLSTDSIGIGTASPETTLDVHAGTGSFPQLHLTAADITLPDYSGSSSLGVGASSNAFGQIAMHRGGAGSNTYGGLKIQGFTESGVDNWEPLALVGTHGGTSPSRAAVIITGQRSNGADNRTALTGSEPILDVTANYDSLSTMALRVQADGMIGLGDFSADTIESKLHLASGEIRLDGGAGNQAGCIMYDDSNDRLRFSHDCSAYSDFGAFSFPVDVEGETVILEIGTGNIPVLINDSTDNNVTLGQSAGENFTATSAVWNTLIGMSAGGEMTTGNRNACVGANSCGGSADTPTTGANNSALGVDALFELVGGGYNTAIGRSAGHELTDGNRNVLIGSGAGYDLTTEEFHVMIGDGAGENYTTASGIVAIGYQAGQGDGTTAPTGVNNTLIGYTAGAVLTTGQDNTFLGYQAGAATTGGDDNVFIGQGTGSANTSGSINTFLGREAGRDNTAGGENLFIGGQAGLLNDVGNRNVYLGNSAGSANDADNNVMVGHSAGDSYTSGRMNVMLGYTVDSPTATATANYELNIANVIYGSIGTTDGEYTTLGDGSGDITIDGDVTITGTCTGCSSGSVSLPLDVQGAGTILDLDDTAADGRDPLMKHIQAERSISFGQNAGLSMAAGGDASDDNVAIGYDAMKSVTTGDNNITIGSGAGENLTTGSSNVLIGLHAGQSDTNLTGSFNVGLGYNALDDISSGANNVALGGYAGELITTASNNVLIGLYAGAELTSGGHNTMVGHAAGGKATLSSGSTFIGYQAGQYHGNTTQGRNVYVGYQAGKGVDGVTDGYGNVAIGYQTMQLIEQGIGNVVVGDDSAKALTDGDGNTFLGDNTGDTYTTGSKNLMVGNGVDSPTSTATASYEINIGNIIYGTVGINDTEHDTLNDGSADVLVDGDWEVTGTFTNSSDRRLKENITDIDDPIKVIQQINGVSYSWIRDHKDAPDQFGVIAQDVQKVLPQLVEERTTQDGEELLSVNYIGFIAPLIEAVKDIWDVVSDLSEKVATLFERDNAQQQEIDLLKERIQILEEKLAAQAQ